MLIVLPTLSISQDSQITASTQTARTARVGEPEYQSGMR